MDRDCQNGSLYCFCSVGNEAGNRFMGREKKGNLNNRTFLGWCGHAFDPRETRGRPAKIHGKVREGAGGGNLNNRTVLGRHRGVRGEGIKSQKCASVPAYQRTSSFLKYIRVRARVYLWKLLVRWYAGTPVRWREAGWCLSNQVIKGVRG